MSEEFNLRLRAYWLRLGWRLFVGLVMIVAVQYFMDSDRTAA